MLAIPDVTERLSCQTPSAIMVQHCPACNVQGIYGTFSLAVIRMASHPAAQTAALTARKLAGITLAETRASAALRAQQAL